MSKDKYLQLIFNTKETKRRYIEKEITREEALMLFDSLLKDYLELRKDSQYEEFDLDIPLLLN